MYIALVSQVRPGNRTKEIMKLNQLLTAARWVAACGALLSFSAFADEQNKKTVITFSEPVEIPGVHLKDWGVLPAGTYVFKIVNSAADRHIVQIFDKEETTVYATILAIPNYRLQATDKTVITFRERPAGQPAALRAWFYPGRLSGEEFVYPKAKAMELARSTNLPVLFTSAELPSEFDDSAKLTDGNLVGELTKAPILAVQPTGEEVDVAQVVTAPPADSPAVTTSRDTQPQRQVTLAQTAPMQTAPMQSAPMTTTPMLPATSSNLPLLGLMGVFSLGAGLAIRRLRQRAA